MLSEKLREAITLIRAGDKLAARKLLVEILEGDPTNETAWLWFVDTLNGNKEKIIALEGLLKINPNSQAARLGLERLTGQPFKSEPQPTPDSQIGRSPRSKGQPVEVHPPASQPAEAPAPVEPPANETRAPQSQPDEARPVESKADTIQTDEAQPEETPSIAAEEISPIDEILQQAEAAGEENNEAEQTEGGEEAVSIVEVTNPEESVEKKDIGALISSPMSKILLVGVAVIGLAVIVFVFFYQSNLRASATECTCVNTDAYLLRVQDRVSRWVNNEAIYEMAESHGDAPNNTEYAQAIYNEENNDQVPVCLKELHETLMITFEYHVKYGNALRSKDQKEISYYRQFEKGMLDQLRDDLAKVGSTLNCTK
jgi:hypothetical protein